ncbi:MAG: CDP-diacylglycerol--serine O-phosphatidyltransferase [Bacteroidota bacterium]|nr:CDP-diacylglycerol--serine O-phosphatidyltransferase [Bacteroidota bacterium]MDX5430675.1 CDP-diacylglycerol--serine O-phosphatidyltransferase [Bacteroidota bacterium]MDX5469422.1 CDP-diacylglycerol--serine O-phosphatidyltransferase [Bacteroidota bacterium]
MKFLPHLITSGNLFCGLLAIVFLAEGELIPAAYCIFIAGLLDFFDGFAARLLKVSGDFGKQLDSLADVVTFGAVPAFMLFKISQELSTWPFEMSAPTGIIYVPLLIGVFSALRLAKFNIDTRQTTGFIGVPTPANAFCLAGLPFLIRDVPESLTYIQPISIAVIAVVSSLLLVAEIPLISLKLKSYSLKDAWPQYLLLFVIGLSLLVFKFAGLLALVPVYLILSLVAKKQNNNEIPG